MTNVKVVRPVTRRDPPPTRRQHWRLYYLMLAKLELPAPVTMDDADQLISLLTDELTEDESLPAG